MPIFPVPSGPFAGYTQAQVQALRAQMQTALVDLISGGKPVTVSYSQGDGARSVTYSAADQATLRRTIASLNDLLGVPSGRRAIGVRFR